MNERLPTERPQSAEDPGARHPDVARTHARLRRLAHVLDTVIPLPGGLRIGLDGLVGLIPGVGDAAGALVSSYIIAEAHRLGVPWVILARMSLNVLLEALVGAVPVVGDLFDFAWKANRRNVALLEAHLENPGAARRRSAWEVGGAVLALLGATALLAWAALAVVAWTWQAVTG